MDGLKKMFNKKAISPLIATVLIVGMTIALASMVIIWGRNMVQTTQEETELDAQSKLLCSQNVEVEIKDICYDNNLKIQIENKKQQEITGFNFRIKGSNSDQIAHEPPLTSLSPMFISIITIPHSQSIVGNIEEIEIIPKITLKDKHFFCPEKIISLSNIPTCT